MRSILLLRLYLEVSTKEDADAIVSSLIDSMKSKCSENSRIINKYWKIPEYFEAFLKLEPSGKSKDNFYDLLEIIGRDWDVYDEQEDELWAVWNYSANKQIVHPAIKWANLELKMS